MTKLTRRQTISLGAAGLGAAALPRHGWADPAPVAFTLLLVNDIYKMNEDKGRGGFPRLAAIVKAERARGVPLLFAHAGDCFSPSLMSGFDQGAHIVELTNIVMPDVFVPGNHEFDFGKEVYFKRLAEAKFPVFAANLRDAEGSTLPGHRDRQIFELGGVKVGVVGLVLEFTPEISTTGDLRFLPVMATLDSQAKALRSEGAEFVVAVAHTERSTDLKIVQSRLVDVLLTGHDHDLAIGYDGKTAMVESNEEGNYVTAIDVTVRVTGEGKDRKVAWAPAFRVNDSRAVTPDPEALGVVNRLEAELSKELDVPVATLAAPLDSRTTLVRSQETAIGDLVADALRAATDADLAITNGGGIRGNKIYAAGIALTRRDILTELPFGNRTVTTKITGKAIKAALENGVSQLENRAGRFPQVSGLRVVIDAKRPVGQRVVSVTVGDKPLDEDATYKVATSDYMLAGGDGYSMLAGGRAVTADAGDRLLANDVMVYARKLGSIDVKPEGRISME